MAQRAENTARVSNRERAVWVKLACFTTVTVAPLGGVTSDGGGGGGGGDAEGGDGSGESSSLSRTTVVRVGGATATATALPRFDSVTRVVVTGPTGARGDVSISAPDAVMAIGAVANSTVTAVELEQKTAPEKPQKTAQSYSRSAHPSHRRACVRHALKTVPAPRDRARTCWA